MRKILIIIFIFWVRNSFGTKYYVSNTGNDANTGTSAIQAWRTIAKVNAMQSSFVAGDAIFFKSGDTWNETLKITKQGALGNPITYGAYGVGVDPKPVITGLTTISSWTNLGSNIWESTSAVSSLPNCNMVVINNAPVAMGRFPNTGYFPYQWHNTRTRLASTSLDGVIDWTGALVSMKRERWFIETDTITSQNIDTLTFTDLGRYDLNDDYGFFIQDDPRTLDTTNEWYYDAGTGKLKIYSTSTPTGVQIANLQNCIQDSSNSKYITIDGLNLVGANQALFDGNFGQYLTITNCDLSFGGTAGIVLNGQNPTVTNNTVNYCLYTGINSAVNGVDGVFSYNTVTNTCLIPGTQERGGGSAMYIVSARGLVEHNVVRNSGWGGILLYGDTSKAQYNLVDSACLVRDDGGGLATHGGYLGMKFLYNIVLNSQGNTDGLSSGFASSYAGHGIYLDDLADHITVTGNTTANNRGVGLFLHRNTNNLLDSNIIYNNGVYASNFTRGQIFYQYSSSPTITNMTITHNTIFARNSNQLVLRFYTSPANSGYPTSMGTSDYNTYVNKTGTTANYFSTYNGTSSINYDLAGWKTLTGQESHSTDATDSVDNTVILVYNPTASDSTVSLGAVYKDLNGNTYSSITLNPFKSQILIYKEALPPQLPYIRVHGKVTLIQLN